MICRPPSEIEARMHSLPKVDRSWIFRSLIAAAGALFVLLVTAPLWGLLHVLGDEAGARVARGVALTAGCAWIWILSGLVVLLAWDRVADDASNVAATPSAAASSGIYDGQRAA